MKTKTLLSLLALPALFVTNIVAAPLGTAFTYQGRLDVGTNPAKSPPLTPTAWRWRPSKA